MLIICSAVLTECRRVTDGWTDGQTDIRAMHTRHAVKTNQNGSHEHDEVRSSPVIHEGSQGFVNGNPGAAARAT